MMVIWLLLHKNTGINMYRVFYVNLTELFYLYIIERKLIIEMILSRKYKVSILYISPLFLTALSMYITYIYI